MREIKAWCDGGCRGNGKETNVGGYGVYMQYIVDGKLIAEKEMKGGAFNTTNNIMELTGAVELMKAIKDKNMKTTIYLDSQYVKNGLESWLNSWKKNNWKTSQKKPVKNKEIWMELDRLKNEFRNLNFCWVKGHADDENNNKVDLLANEYMDALEKHKLR